MEQSSLFAGDKTETYIILYLNTEYFRPGHGYQNAAFDGHHRTHCLGFQFLELPIGM